MTVTVTVTHAYFNNDNSTKILFYNADHLCWFIVINSF